MKVPKPAFFLNRERGHSSRCFWQRYLEFDNAWMTVATKKVVCLLTVKQTIGHVVVDLGPEAREGAVEQSCTRVTSPHTTVFPWTGAIHRS